MNERDRLAGFTVHLAETLFADDALNETLADTVRAVEKCNSVVGLREAAGDMVEFAEDLSEERVQSLDQELDAKSLPTLTQMRNSRYRHLQRILARPSPKDAEEYRLVESFLSDTAGTTLSEAERSRASEVLANFDKQ